MKKLFFLLIPVYCQLFADEPKPHEIWWERCLGEKVSWDTFYSWLGDENDPIRQTVKEHVLQKNYSSFLDAGSGLCIDYWNLKFAKENIDYLGLEITPKLIDRAKLLGIPVIQGSIEAIPLQDNAFDLCFARHILDHLDGYQKAMNELIRVAKKEALVVFFIRPSTQEQDQIVLGTNNGYDLYHNQYCKKKLEEFILQNPKVKGIKWNELNIDNTLLHIELHNST